MVGQSVGWLVGLSISQLVGQLVGQSVGWLVGWSVGGSVGRSVGRSVGWLVGLSVSQPVSQSVGRLSVDSDGGRKEKEGGRGEGRVGDS